MDVTLWSYAIYLLVSTSLTVWVATTLRKHGNVFLVDASHGNKELAESLGHLLQVGFYLVAIGYISMAMRLRPHPVGAQEAVEALSTKEGMVLLVLGALHFLHLWLYAAARRRALDDGPPVEPDARLAAPLS